MFLFKSVDKKIEELGFKKVKEDQHGVTYERYNDKFESIQCVDILYKSTGGFILHSYGKNLCYAQDIGLTDYEEKLFDKKMDKMDKVIKSRRV